MTTRRAPCAATDTIRLPPAPRIGTDAAAPERDRPGPGQRRPSRTS